MSLFGSIGKVFGTATKAVLTGGISLVAPKLIPKFIDAPLTQLTKALAPTTLSGILRTGVGVATANPLLLLPSQQGQGERPMSLNVGGILGQVSSIFGGSQNPYFQGISNVSSLATNFFPQPTAQTVAQRMPMPIIPRAAPLAQRGVIGRSFFNRFPNLGMIMQQWRDRGVKITRSSLYSLLKRWGPDILITGGILTAAAVSELMMAGPGHRRLNPANAKALRRAGRRIRSFHKLCGTVDLLKSRGRRSSGRCGSCRKSPCKC